jgi:uncharacterized protein (TIGR03086 family)
MRTTTADATIEADPNLPIIRITRDFAATPAQLMRAHTDPELFARWVGPDGIQTRIVEWDVRDGGAWRYIAGHDGEEYAFRGCFHRVGTDAIVQTFTWEAMPEDVSLETLRFEDLGDGRTRLHAQSLVDSFESRDAWLRSGMEVGVDQGYAKLDALLAARAPAERHRAVAGVFTDRVEGVRDWDAPAPVDGWVARDVVDHLVTWFPGFLATGGVELPAGPSVATDPVAAWRHHSDAVQALLDAPDAGRPFTHPQVGEFPLDVAIERFYTADVFMHTWDLARASGQDDLLDASFAAELLSGMVPMEEVIRSSGQYGAAFPVPDDAPVQDRLLGFIGRDPSWRPATV